MDVKTVFSLYGILLFSASLVNSQGNDIDEVLNYECFTALNDSAIFGHNDRVIESDDPSEPLDVEICKSACLAETEFVCRSFDFLQDNNRCYLSAASAQTHPEMLGEHYFAVYYERAACQIEPPEPQDPEDSECFTALNDSAIFGHNDRVIESEQLDVETCKSACLAETEFVCLSFDFLQDNNRCYLSAASASTHPEMLGEHYFSVYYERAPCPPKPTPEPFSCFTSTDDTAMYGHNDREIGADDPSVHDFDVEICKTECLAETGFVCRSFDYVDGNRCYLSNASSISDPSMIGDHHFSVYYERADCPVGGDTDDNEVEEEEEDSGSGGW